MLIQKTFGAKLAIILLIAFTASAQNGKDEPIELRHQKVIWTGLAVRADFQGPYSLGIEVEERRYLNFDRGLKTRDQQRVLPNVFLERQLPQNWKIGLGQWIFTLNLPWDPQAEVERRVPEHRSYAYISKSWPLENGQRLGLRLKSERHGASHFSGPIVRQDYRQRIKLAYTWPLGKKWRFQASEEIHINVASTGDLGLVHHNRLATNFSRKWGPRARLKTTLGLLHWLQPTDLQRSFYSRYIFRLQLEYRFPFPTIQI